MTVSATTELEAVNIMLAAITETPVTTLDEDTIEDAQIALSVLRQVSKDFQAKGWHFNTDFDYPLSPNVDNKIAYPENAAHVDAMDDTGYDVVKRGGFLWDRDNRTFLFTGLSNLRCKIIWMFDFEDLPQMARSYIALMAARRFAENVMGDEATVKYTAADEEAAKIEWVADDMRQGDYNMLRGSASVNRAVRRRPSWVG